ncbi:hypothetical protein HMI54_002458 [Coelomomyces lativittatus]|nr:hypothetical protein HMI55_003475 [Coelomomyces lativittatus]KAJ1506261.1 hypothetical protein HMI56_000689 [Coelomomyces lativittatus]KAJ1509312.1 hypothetical protein HMI54_002458 [Coelomomyces lativittatus]
MTKGCQRKTPTCHHGPIEMGFQDQSTSMESEGHFNGWKRTGQGVRGREGKGRDSKEDEEEEKFGEDVKRSCRGRGKGGRWCLLEKSVHRYFLFFILKKVFSLL